MEVTIGFATAASGTAIEDRGGGERGARKDPFFAAQCQFHSESPFQDIVRPTMGTLAARKGEREEGGRRAGRAKEGEGGEGRPTPTEEPGEFFSGAGTKGEHHRLATLSQDGVTDGRASLWNTSGKTGEGCLRQTAWCQRETER